ncbi:glucosamine 6-phosphate N-acetyltransferase, putative [Entamoeba histolytica HM-1:IMSS-B]|uniref:Glucosamine 6-phosphate N-acetyltransferase n=7 Tax=Entamoeba TaxID=5758 RepID=C4LWQ1_ENTH1|nr:glucosamine 6-phosphate N-acetyltransferase, putative [Entamoeba nuttalli P19]XP_655194.1 glucosamine 6-phosphate N-acetyltransferase [Entamoeba histolytica HM-1:IMSS]EMD43054.1 glucosamine 6phosphate N-acetyltransferase, putative [Entamoeba histolytica KU27]EMH73006.1 glucosamine 6-phosphate N-acetyltransferase, putative [Entamoeba histolytica HM-1:IMSS-B]EMS11270.1 glucosamine 6-phosphate N-acetyltransferase [Entamoeba histolytica HM-3:IMSS]ENY65035.1 glucosamine 6-phosphate N-acetyltrans|eukprot:XP_008858473.1 glucosamine 6-phosphate N-acetyltransferase, putative [Entamoeba nuttalli P19]
MTSLFISPIQLPQVGTIQFRALQKEDYDKGVCSVLEQLTSCSTDKNKFNDVFDLMKKENNYYIVVGEDLSTSQIILTGTLFIESKIIHNGSSVGHIEDIAVSNSYRKMNLGRILIDTLVKLGQVNSCYKIILDCSSSVLPFYEKCGLSKKGHFMAIYF